MKKINLKEKLKDLIYIYRYDIFSLVMMLFLILWFLQPLFDKGHVVFSDMAFGFTSGRYMEEIFGVWNERWSTTTLLNIPRLLYILPPYILSKIFNYSGPVLLKSFIIILILNSAISMYLFSKRIISIYFSKEFNFFKIFALLTGAIFYALNPWVIYRIQHIYLLCGYSLFPLVLMFFFNLFDPKFQAQLIPNYEVSNIKLYKRNVIDIFMISIIFTISAGGIHYFFYGLIFLFVIGMLLLMKQTIIFVRSKEFKRLKRVYLNFALKIFTFGTVFCFFSFYWLSMYFGSILFKAQASQHNINVVDTLSLFSRYSTPVKVLYLVSYWWPMFNIEKLPITFYMGGAVLIFYILYAMVFRAYKENIILFFTILSLLFVLLSTGVTLPLFADYFVIIVTKVPIIGSMFRDPNKFVGLMAVGFSLLLTFGVEAVLHKLEANIYNSILKGSLVLGVIGSFWLYINPFYQNFIQGFYHPVEIPKEYLEVQKHFIDKDRFDSKVLYMPIADNMTQSNTGVATPFWNKNPNITGMEKATGDIQVYTSQKNTIFHHEGNIPSITYYLNFLQYVMDRGISSNIGTLVSNFGINELAYHKEYVGQEERQEFNKKLLELQEGLSKKYEDDIFSLYKVPKPIPYMYQVPKKLYTPYGLSRLETYNSIPNFNFKDIGVIFSSIEPKSYITSANKGDYIEAVNMRDLLLSNLPNDNYIKPFEFIDSANPFLKWAKTLPQNNEWLWFLSSQGIQNFPFDFDQSSGIGVTFASSKLNVLPYRMKSIKGKLVADFNSLLRTEKFFVPDNPQFFNVQAAPMTDVNAIPMLYGQIASGDPKNIWQVAKSGLLEAKENNPYQFNIAVSGRGVNKMHIKVRFFDDNMKELGISYVVAPTESVNFDAVNFFGEYISPFGSKYMRIDILSYQMPEQRTYWWIHDMKLFDLEEYKAPNEFIMKKKFDTDTKAHVYGRVLSSKVGGNLKISFPKDRSVINTKDISLNQFTWIDLGIHSFDKGENNIAVENVSGFNAVNVFAIIPEEDFERTIFPVKKAVERSKIFASLEAENDFSYSGNLQSERAYPSLSFGKGISSQSGSLSRDIEVLKDGIYSLALNINGYPLNNGRIIVDIINKYSGEATNRIIETNSFKLKTEKAATMIDYNPLSKGYPYTIDKLSDTLQYYYRVDLKNMFFSSGDYTIKLTFDSKVPSVSTFSDFHKFDVSEVKLPPFIADIFQEDCSDCDRVTKDMMNNKITSGVMRIDYEKTCSCDWYVYASNKIKVNPKEEYLVNVEARSENIRKRHMKVIFLDDDMNVIDVTYINEVEEKDKAKWNKYEQIIKVPEKATLMQYHILARGEKLSNGYLELKNFSIIPYNHMLLVDNVIFYEGTDLDNFFNISEKKVEEVNYEKIDRMKRRFKVSNPAKERVLLNYCESPNPVWQIDFGEKQRGTMILNGVTTGFIVNESGEGTTKVILRELYYFGLLVFFLGFVVTFVIYEFYTTENSDNNLKKLTVSIRTKVKNATYSFKKLLVKIIDKVDVNRFKRNRR
ncbi:hypothetical protein [Clostridium manihotivorum]|uniref:hypothetical protein n=1 Tax=Clostridium manihotivorum TaxID=2320868 RepID=UPI00196B32DB|nr:hypothetical protein [Clostridium manihotivorum]